MKLGFIGYGEAAHALALGYRSEGLNEMFAWSPVYMNDPAEAGVAKLETEEDVFRTCDVILVLVPGSAAVNAAKACKPFLKPHHVYLDLSTAAPRDMQTVWEMIRDTGVRFADGAMLDSVPKFRHKVPTVLCGNGAEAAYNALTPYGANMEIVGEKPGDADAIKLLRSVYTKAHLACAFEMLEAASFYGVEDYVMHSLAVTMDGKTFLEGMNDRTAGGVLHADRRSHELESAAEMLEADGLSAPLCRAGAGKLKEIGDLHIRDKMPGYRPKDWKEAIEVVRKFKEEAKKETP
ncbi:MAG: NAD(P)-dependent oxidoreductase [Lachnospiraceae bacterium]|nr:NAD(P)-dependent oxidoreductase [Lachnospiraceae bacterium]